MQGLAVRLTLIAEAEDEERAREIGAAFVARTGLDSLFLSWAPYDKMGPHSRMAFALFLPEIEDGQGVVDAVEAIAALAVAPEALVDGYLNGFLQDDGSLVYNRIFDARTDPFLIPGVLWLDIEVETHPDAQASLKKSLASGG